MELTNIKVGVLAGGVSEERDISLLSGRQVFSALERKNIKAEFIDIKTSENNEIKKIIKAAQIDLAFIALHGSFGEDGKIQTILQEIPLAYTGSGPKASLFAMDKIIAKERFSQSGVKTAFYRLATAKNYNYKGLTYPVVVKPSHSGSSFGISIVDSKEKIKEALKESFKFSESAIIEDYIKGRELTVGILGETPLAVVEIVPQGKYFDFKNKYTKGNSVFVVPAKLDKKIYKQLQQLALQAHKALGCRDFSRVDIKLKGDLPYVLEVNSIPGLTERSLLPLSASACGISFDELIFIFVEKALSRRKKVLK
ncbi:MAG: D-alanine--D-alanine ligase [Candidatus Omnitrophica bacterium]|nr:D-alanine--D-alanine ligase [Candidatus Omnitrophota bacterium]MCF7893595.1 D-alanine--D-alanine ligase [Candidatus Omnitrophota bacterium]